MKLARPKERLLAKMGWVADFSQPVIWLIGGLEMLGAAITHPRRGEYANLCPVVVLAGLASFVAWGRFTDWPL